MQNKKNPILNFRGITLDSSDSTHESYNVILGGHDNGTKKFIMNLTEMGSSTMITLTREAADSTEHSE